MIYIQIALVAMLVLQVVIANELRHIRKGADKLREYLEEEE